MNSSPTCLSEMNTCKSNAEIQVQGLFTRSWHTIGNIINAVQLLDVYKVKLITVQMVNLTQLLYCYSAPLGQRFAQISVPL